MWRCSPRARRRWPARRTCADEICQVACAFSIVVCQYPSAVQQSVRALRHIVCDKNCQHEEQMRATPARVLRTRSPRQANFTRRRRPSPHQPVGRLAPRSPAWNGSSAHHVIDRSGRTATLTAAGAAVFDLARQALASAGAVRQTVEEINGLLRGRLSLATGAPGARSRLCSTPSAHSPPPTPRSNSAWSSTPQINSSNESARATSTRP